MDAIGARIEYIKDQLGLSNRALGEHLGIKSDAVAKAIQRNRLKEFYVNILSEKLNVNKNWLLTGQGIWNNTEPNDIASVEAFFNDGEKTASEIKVNDSTSLDFYENKNGNQFIRLDTQSYMMLMPKATYEVQAGFLDNYQNIEFLADLEKHTIIVKKPYHGRYIAFTVTGASMDDNTSEAITHNSIVTTRELQRHLWKDKLRIKDFPYWVIFSTKNQYPIIKQITHHDVEKGIITLHSLNDSPEFSDFTLDLNTEVNALFNVIQVTRNVGKEGAYE